MPEDMIAFMDLMRLEGDTPSMIMSDKENRKVINMTLSEMLERALLFEQHLEKYPNEVSSEPRQECMRRSRQTPSAAATTGQRV